MYSPQGIHQQNHTETSNASMAINFHEIEAGDDNTVHTNKEGYPVVIIPVTDGPVNYGQS